MVNESVIKNIRMGWKNSFIKGVILNDDTILQNMQCRLDAKTPTNDELEKINKENMQNIEEKVLMSFNKKNANWRK